MTIKEYTHAILVAKVYGRSECSLSVPPAYKLTKRWAFPKDEPDEVFLDPVMCAVKGYRVCAKGEPCLILEPIPQPKLVTIPVTPGERLIGAWETAGPVRFVKAGEWFVNAYGEVVFATHGASEVQPVRRIEVKEGE